MKYSDYPELLVLRDSLYVLLHVLVMCSAVAWSYAWFRRVKMLWPPRDDPHISNAIFKWTLTLSHTMIACAGIGGGVVIGIVTLVSLIRSLVFYAKSVAAYIKLWITARQSDNERSLSPTFAVLEPPATLWQLITHKICTGSRILFVIPTSDLIYDF